MIKDRIKELREKNGLTISAFAKSLGISPTSASLYESGKQNPGKKTIAKIIKELREKNGLTISAFAKSLGISPTSASLYESGKQNPGKKTIAKICEVYGVDEGYLLSTPGDKATPIDKATPTTKATSTAKEDDKAVEEKKRGRRPKKTDVVNEEKELDITAILARVAEIGVRKAAAEIGVAWQTVNKWKKDAEKAATPAASTWITISTAS